MKKIILLASVVALSAASCKKDRTCTCTVTPVSSTVNGVTQTVSTPFTYTQKITKVSKNGAHCNSGTNTDTETTGSVTQIDVTKYDCKLD